MSVAAPGRVPALPALPVAELLRRYHLHPDKRLGQNFLVDPLALQRVVEAAEISPGEAVLEIGPGLGSLTRYLCLLARRVVAVELDEKLIPPLREVLSPYPNLHLVQGDILGLNPLSLMAEPSGTAAYLVVANIPYYITSALLRHLLEAPAPPRRMILTVQREVAERICASAGEMSLLALSVQVYGTPHIAAHIPAGAFYPAPQVDSSIVRVDVSAASRLAAGERRGFFRLAKAGFSQKRKTLRNALAGGMHWSPQQASDLLLAAGIDPQRRAETLSLEEWSALAAATQAARLGGQE
ncbi:MAG: 16S rRNA (adenine(1518)-N(6)/adenine(1519)-N(6))-dimethyltransferase RsmA [Anaerolineales bacterium]|nr:16S rRNA (adenine(1518)-N(6)/adenine(1519)-N(6))-dimethyltransferase RsmA [Anaerolineales bacterium]